MWAQALDFVEQITQAGLTAHTDPDKAAANRPCVLVTPPIIDWQTRSGTWQLAVLTSHAVGSEAAWKQLDDTLAALVVALDNRIERAQPSAYYLTAEFPAVACYLAQVTTSH